MQSIIPVNRFTLANGLRVVHSYDPTTAMVAVDVLYNVGARDESRRLTGMAHLFEHLMFGGSVNVPSFDGEIESAGGKNNAWTSNDFTNFYDVVPAQNIATAFHLESDRMLGLDFNERSLEVQRGVVIEEFKQTCLDRPYGDLFHHLRRLAYAENHPYSWPVIGLEPEHIARVTMDDVRRWFYAHYAPNNAILAVSGRVELEEVKRLAEEWFGDIPARAVAPRHLPAAGFPAESVVETVTGNVPLPDVVVAFPMSAYGTEEYFAADAITDLLSAGRAARFQRELFNGEGAGLFAAADASISGSEHEGLLLLHARVNENTDEAIARATAMMLDSARRLAEPGAVSERELQRSFNNFEADFRFSNVGYLNRAINLAMAEYHGEDINRVVTDRRRLTPEIISRTARKILVDSPSVTIIYKPNSDKQ